MDLISDTLAPHSDLIGKIAGTITSLQMLSGLFLLNDIRVKGSTEKFPVGPFLGGIVLSILGLKYGAILNDDKMINVNLFGLVLNVFYLIGFYYYTPSDSKSGIFSALGKALAFSGVCLLYAYLENPKAVEFRFGMLMTGTLLLLVGMPLLEIPNIIEKQCTEGLPFPIIFSGFCVSTAWMLYGFSIKNEVFILQNGLLAVITGLQVSLFAIYPNSLSESTKTEKKPSQKKTD